MPLHFSPFQYGNGRLAGEANALWKWHSGEKIPPPFRMEVTSFCLYTWYSSPTHFYPLKIRWRRRRRTHSLARTHHYVRMRRDTCVGTGCSVCHSSDRFYSFFNSNWILIILILIPIILTIMKTFNRTQWTIIKTLWCILGLSVNAIPSSLKMTKYTWRLLIIPGKSFHYAKGLWSTISFHCNIIYWVEKRLLSPKTTELQRQYIKGKAYGDGGDSLGKLSLQTLWEQPQPTIHPHQNHTA